MQKPYVIGIGHRKRMGKDTLGMMLVEDLHALGVDARQVSFSRVLKSVCSMIFGTFSHDHYERNPEAKLQIHKPSGKTHRDLMIELGMAVRGISADAWVQAALNSNQGKEVLVISDVRFPNELEICDLTIKVHRDTVALSDDPADCALDGFTGWTREAKNLSLEGLRMLSQEVAYSVARKVHYGRG